jgi:hypothetical protein
MWALAANAAEPLYISGIAPDRRPQPAPTLRDFRKDPSWYVYALRGVASPYPASLRFLEDQGAWFTPFVHPGMTGPYDLRQWHLPSGHAIGEQ